MERSRINRAVALCNFLIILTILPTVAVGQFGQRRFSRGPNSIPVEPKASASECPSEVGGGPSADIPQPNDFVELQRTSCFGACPVYTVRIRADGNVQGVVARQPVTANVSPADARALIDSLAANGFWYLCGRYAWPATDGPTTLTTLHIGDHEKRVSNYFNGAPRLLQEFEYEIDSLADTHRWIHGDPRKELMGMGNVRSDGSGVKPGLTPLMRAALVADTRAMPRLLAAQSDPNAQDSSGWTALVYAAQGEKRGRVDAATYSSGVESVKMLLDSGADPNVRSFMGQTPLMAAVTAYYSPVEKAKLLIAAGADVNVQDKNGHTALMDIISGSLGQDIPGKYAQQVELCSMLVADGARTDLRDSGGRTVFDILEEELRRWSAPAQPAAFVQSVRMQYEALLKALHF